MARAARLRQPDPEIFRVDRPFLFYLVDDTTGAILFQGRIVDPRLAAGFGGTNRVRYQAFLPKGFWPVAD